MLSSIEQTLSNLEEFAQNILIENNIDHTWPNFLYLLVDKSKKGKTIDAAKILFRVHTVRGWIDKDDTKNAVHETLLLMTIVNNANINILTPKLKREQKAEKGRSKGGTNKAAAEKDIRENHNLKIADYAIKLLNERKCTERELSGIVASSEVVKESNIRKRGLSSKQVREILREFDILK